LAGKFGGKIWRENLAGKFGGKMWRENLAGKSGGKIWREIGIDILYRIFIVAFF
jgi:hypothetical protein